MIPESQLFDYMRTSSHAASIKSPESGEYIFSNAENTKLMGFGSTDDLMGLTASRYTHLCPPSAKHGRTCLLSMR